MALRIVAENNITNDHIFSGVCHTPCLGILVAWSTTWIVSQISTHNLTMLPFTVTCDPRNSENHPHQN